MEKRVRQTTSKTEKRQEKKTGKKTEKAGERSVVWMKNQKSGGKAQERRRGG